jgi:hypothetical protein
LSKFVKKVPHGARASERGTNTSMLASIRRRRLRTDPQGVIPANRMPYAGMANAGDRADLVAYLLKATKNVQQNFFVVILQDAA